MSLSEWLMKLPKFWEWSSETSNQITALCAISWIFLKDLIIFLINKLKSFMFMLSKIKNFIFNWIREKIVGKENLELLKELEGNKWAIDFLNRLRETDEAKIKIGYEALNAFIILYSDAADRVSPVYLCRFEDSYKEDEKYGVDSHRHFSNVYKLREEIFQELIKKYSK